MPADMARALPAEVARFAFTERLVAAHGARSLDVLALLLHVAATLWLDRTAGVSDFAAVVQPATARLIPGSAAAN
jgi:hypothetical protein